MMYFLIHSQKLKTGQTANQMFSYAERDEAEIAYHQTVASDMSDVDAVDESRVAVLKGLVC